MLEIQDVREEIEVQRWSQQLQRRVIRLLLQHDTQLFRSQFRLFFVQSRLPAIPLLQQYDRYIKLQMFSHELLDDILPRIRRQLSLKTNHVRLREEAPTRGDIDWLRSLEQSWHHTPGLPPQQFETRLRQRSMETIENLLTVAILLAYRQELQRAMDDLFEDEELNTLEKQVLTSAYEQIKRELAAPYARALLERAQQARMPELMHQVTLQLRPGPSPYRDLLIWWQSFTQFHIGRSSAERSITLASTRSDEKADAWLYELWIVLECMHLLQGESVIQPQDITVATDLLLFTFTWQGRRFRFIYNRQLDTATNGYIPTWEHAPASRPDYTIERERPLEISDHGASIWREPPVLLDAKYYLEGNDPARTHEPIKKLLGDMTLIGARVGALFFPRLPEPDADQQITRTIRQSDRQYQAQQQVQQIHLYHLDPDMSFPNLQKRLHALLDMVVQHLPERPAPACQGFLLDADTVNASKQALPMLRVVCPKPHIGLDVFDLVNQEEHCLKDARFCHVKGQLILPPQVMRVHTLDDLKGHIQQIRAFGEEALKQATEQDDQVEQFHSHVLNRVGTMIEQYVQAHGDTTACEKSLKQWVFAEFWDQNERCLSHTTRNILISGEYIWAEYQKTNLKDWAAPAIQFCRALEAEIKRRIHDHYPDAKAHGFEVPYGHMTLGAIETIIQLKGDNPHSSPLQKKARILAAIHNWSLCEMVVNLSGSDIRAFESTLWRMVIGNVAHKRNQLAHGGPISKELAEELYDTILGSKGKPGVLSWLVENLDPKS